MVKRNEIIIFGSVLIIAIVAIIFINATKSDGSKVVITIDGKEYKTLDLNINTTLTIEDGYGAYNIIEVKDGAVDMIEANCPDKICAKHKMIHYNGETIVCLPHKVVLEIIDGEDNEVDMIAK